VPDRRAVTAACLARLLARLADRLLARLTVALTVGVVAAAPAAAEIGADTIGAADAARLERLVRQDCGSCHGLTLKGGLGPDIRAQTLAHWDRDGLTQVILDGIPGTAMPPWRPLLSDAEARWISDYLLDTE